eukprot:TRINITY_DN5829_c0_g1_i3.p1 TRINITY_DN5829_c0_g1~~TRINITY_DN5829_c0_g1_i3.p1  ORF type:complete len:194 (+),score=49.18 TRINITY_DN5829_c0_g1_i3:52-633(+)
MAELSLNHLYFSKEVVVKNTFLEFGASEQAPLRRIWSAPAMVQLPLAHCVQMHVAASHELLGGTEIQKKYLQPPFAPCMQVAAAGNHEIEGKTGIQTKHVASGVASMPDKAVLKEEQHRLGLCRPCSYFTFKDDGCHKGDDCEFCHMCSNEGARERRRQIKKELGPKAAFATQAHGNKKKFRNKKPCSNTCCA